MLYWVIYDISENNVRTKVSSKCKNYGLQRIQKSAFIGELTNNKAEMLALEAKEILGEKDCIFVFPTCKTCFESKLIIGSFDQERLKERKYFISGA